MDTDEITHETSLPQRFWGKVAKTGECWIWTAATDGKGYGVFQTYYMTGKIGTRRAHILHWEDVNGEIPDGMMLDHTCYSRSCVNLDHIRLATNAENGQNRKGAQRNSRTGVRGVVITRNGRFRAEARCNGRSFSKTFQTLEDADQAVRAWRREHMPYSLADQDQLKEAA